MYSYYEPWTDYSPNTVVASPENNTKEYEIVAIAHTHGNIGHTREINVSGA